MKFLLLPLFTILLLSSTGLSSARLLRGQAHRELGNCQILEFTRKLEYGPVIVPQGTEDQEKFLIVSQKSGLFVGEHSIGAVHATATVIRDRRIGQGGYTFEEDSPFGTGTILFEGSVANSDLKPDVNNPFEVAIIGGTGDFRCAKGWVQVGSVIPASDPKERDVILHLCQGPPGQCK